MEQQTPIPPQIKDEAARRAKTRHFSIFDLGGRGGQDFPFILSKIVVTLAILRQLNPSDSFRFVLQVFLKFSFSIFFFLLRLQICMFWNNVNVISDIVYEFRYLHPDSFPLV